MSPTSLRWKYRALRLAMTVGCVSSLQLAGCLNNPTRSDLASEAGKAALVAEEDISNQKVEAAEKQAASEATSQPSRVVLSGGETPDHDGDSRVVQTAGEESEAAPKKSFWSFLTPKPKKPAIKDPFADHPELKTSTQAKNDARPESSQGAPGKARLAPSSAAVPDSRVSEKDDYSPERWFEKELANQPAPSWVPVGDSRAFGETAGAFDRTSPFESLDRSDKAASTTGSIAPETTWNPQRSDLRKPARGLNTDDWTAADTSRNRPTAQAATPPGTDRSMNQLASRQQKLRIQALMSEAHTCALRGELHAAYRCALLAEKIAEENQLTFAASEENPQEYARTLAAKLWRTSNVSEESYLASTEAATNSATSSGKRTTTPHKQEQSSHVVANSPFPNGNFATWQPLKDTPRDPQAADSHREGLTAAHLEQPTSAASGLKMASAAGNSPLQQRSTAIGDLLPEIRPWPNERPVQNVTPPLGFGTPTAGIPANSAATMQQNLTEPTHPQQAPNSDQKVQFAIAHEVQEEKSPALLDSVSSSDSDATWFGSQSGRGKLASATAGHQRPVLLAPPVPAERPSQAASESTLTWEQLSRTRKGDQHSNTADSGWNWKNTWSLLGLLAAGICTGAGIWYSRRSPAKSSEELPETSMAHESAALAATSLSPAVEHESGGEEPEVKPLQFKRAA